MKPIDFTQQKISASACYRPGIPQCRLVFSEGSGSFDDISFETGVCALVMPEKSYIIQAAAPDSVLQEISFAPALLNVSLSGASRENAQFSLPNPPAEFLGYGLAYCKMLSIESAMPFSAIENGLSSLLYCFSDLLNRSAADADSHACQLAEQAKVIIQTEYMNDLTLQAVATRLFVSPCYLSTVFHQASGTTFKAYLRDVRLDHTCRLLTQTNYMVTDIAMQTGFNSTAYLISSFRKAYGITPNAYRTQQKRAAQGPIL